MKKEIDVNYTTEGLRKALIDEINGLRNGTTTLAKAKAVSDLAKQIFNICKLEADLLTSQENGHGMIPVALVDASSSVVKKDSRQSRAKDMV